jgi:hypothetical protein
MRSLWADRVGMSSSRRIHLVLGNAADEICGTLARVIAYVLALVFVGMIGFSVWDQLPHLEASEPAKADWMIASRSHRAYSVGRRDSDEKSVAYEIVRHPQGGRKDRFRWTGAGDGPAAELEIYRLGTEADAAADPRADLAARMPSAEPSDLEAAGVIDSKFGILTLLRPVGAREGVKQGAKDEAARCLGFLKRIDDPALQISGWSCQGSSVAMRRAAISCLLNRLTLLGSGNDPKLAEFFARAELKRGSCANPPLAGELADWVTRADGPRLRGAL